MSLDRSEVDRLIEGRRWSRVHSLLRFERELCRALPEDWEADRRNNGSRREWPGRMLAYFRLDERPGLFGGHLFVFLDRSGRPLAAVRRRYKPNGRSVPRWFDATILVDDSRLSNLLAASGPKEVA